MPREQKVSDGRQKKYNFISISLQTLFTLDDLKGSLGPMFSCSKYVVIDAEYSGDVCVHM